MKQIFSFVYTALVCLTLLNCSGDGDSGSGGRSGSTTYLNIISPTAINLANRSIYPLRGKCHGREQTLSLVLTDSKGRKLQESTVCSSEGQWGVELEVDWFDDGEVNISVSYEEAGGVVRTADATIVKDVIPPMVRILGSGNIPQEGSNAYSFNGECSEPQQVVTIEISDSAHTPQSTQLQTTCSKQRDWAAQVDASQLADGVVRIVATQEDKAGNPSNVEEQEVSKDTMAPELKWRNHNHILAGGDGHDISGYCSDVGKNVKVTFTDSADPPASLVETVTCGTDNIWTVSAFDLNALANGAVTIEVFLADELENSVTETVTVQKGPGDVWVAINATSIVNASNVSNYTLAGSCSSVGGDVTVTVNGKTPINGATLTCSEGSWEARFDLSVKDDGPLAGCVWRGWPDGGGGAHRWNQLHPRGHGLLRGHQRRGVDGGSGHKRPLGGTAEYHHHRHPRGLGRQ